MFDTSPYNQKPVSSIDRMAVLALVPCTSIALEIFLGNWHETYILSLLTVTYTIFLSLIFDVFKTLLVLKPNLKEVIEAISPFAFVFKFSNKNGKTRLTFPKAFAATPFVSITDNDNSVAGINLDYAIGWNTSTYVDISNVTGGFTMLLIGII